MEINKNLLEFVWQYASTHDFVSRAIVSGIYIDKFGIEAKRIDRKPQQKAIGRKIAQMFTIMNHLGISSKFSQRTTEINREVFNIFTLEDVLKCKLSDFHKK